MSLLPFWCACVCRFQTLKKYSIPLALISFATITVSDGVDSLIVKDTETFLRACVYYANYISLILTVISKLTCSAHKSTGDAATLALQPNTNTTPELHYYLHNQTVCGSCTKMACMTTTQVSCSPQGLQLLLHYTCALLCGTVIVTPSIMLSVIKPVIAYTVYRLFIISHVKFSLCRYYNYLQFITLYAVLKYKITIRSRERKKENAIALSFLLSHMSRKESWDIEYEGKRINGGIGK